MEDIEKKYPGRAFDPLGYSKDPAKLKEYKVKEIKNAMQSLSLAQGVIVGRNATARSVLAAQNVRSTKQSTITLLFPIMLRIKKLTPNTSG
ncbi:Chlorophyll A-B binding protein [Dillenia turbinata]|uniref:Chlorophyll A-B binding protein n=1 Tax=Dillenia turbinata TaxID=194707 RepID=A0AAN8VNT2_9MAGN